MFILGWSRARDPNARQATLGEVSAELERIQFEVQALLDRQRQIAAQLRGMLELRIWPSAVPA